jgi:membrane dipeptidase
MLIDVTHATPAARDEALTIVGTRRPVVMTHVGAHHYQPESMNPTDAEIRRIAETGGMIGVIFMNHWLRDSAEKEGLRFVVDTMLHIRDVGGIESVGIGSDFDGFTDPPDDLTDHTFLPRLTDSLCRAGLAPTDVESILGGNARRVLTEGWGA